MRKISYIKFSNVSKTYSNNKNETIKDFNLTIKKGEFIVIVGPSGSGKSTLLQLICGFENLTEGTIEIDGNIINDVMPKDRDVSMVFQNYALFPHLTSYENIEFGMKIRKVKKGQRKEKIKWASELLGLNDVINEKPKNLSGGQRQRVALARAIVREPKLFLMDEPLSNLDAKLRYATSNEITRLHKNINATTIYVTHDQVEALTMADRIVVLNEGKIQQIGTPREIYDNPQNLFVANFIGRPEINKFTVRLLENYLTIDNYVKIPFKNSADFSLEEDRDYILAIRSEYIKVVQDSTGIKATITNVEYLGGETILYLDFNSNIITAKVYDVGDYKKGDEINIMFDLNRINIFDKDTKENIRRIIK